MKGQLYSVYVLTVLASIFAVTQLAAYLSAGANNADNFTTNFVPLGIGVCFAIATFTMYKKHPLGWITFLIGILVLTVQAALTISLENLQVITTICVYLFMIFYLIDDHVMRMFGVKK